MKGIIYLDHEIFRERIFKDENTQGVKITLLNQT